MTSLVNDLGGSAGFGEFSLPRNDDGSTSFIDLTPIFGAQGVNYFGHYYTGFWLNNNGSVTFNAATSSFTPSSITGSTSNPIIAAFWADIDTRGGEVTATPGGTSTGSNLLWYDLDAVTHTFTATWDDVGYYGSHNDKLNAFQLSIHEINAQGDFDIIFRYENVDWTTGDASDGSNGLGGTPARAGYSAGNGTDYFELPQSGNQAALLALESASNVGTPGTFVFSVRNGVPTVGVTAGDASADEGNGGEGDTRTVDITVYLTEASASTITVHYATADGTALAGQDYVAQSGTLTFAAGVTQQTIRVAVIGDTAVESDESFTVTLSNASEGASILDGTATGVIRNDDVTPAALSIAATSADKAEGQSGSTSFTFTVTGTGDLSGGASASWAVGGEGVNGADFTGGELPSGVVNFAAGESSKVVTVEVAGDTAVEANESFSVTLSNPSTGAVIGTASATGVIRNDDTSLAIAATSADKAEGDIGATPFTFTVTRSGDLSGTSSVHWAVSGDAVTDSDFIPTEDLLPEADYLSFIASIAGVFFPDFSLFGGLMPAGDVSFAAGESAKTITVWGLGETLVEGDQNFTVTLSGASAGTLIEGATAEGTLREDDAPVAGSVFISDVSVTEGNSGTRLATFTVTRSGGTAAFDIDYATSDGTATVANHDYVATSGTLHFADGDDGATFSVVVNGDTNFEADETFFANLSGATNGALLGGGTGTATILNDDAVPVTVESFGTTKLDRVDNQFFLHDAEGTGPALRFQGSPYVDGLFGVWTPIGAEKTASGYQVAWKFGAADQYVVWNLDNGGNFIGDVTGVVSGANLSLQVLETTFEQDLNSNGHIGPTTTTIENFGATRLDELGNQFFLHDIGGAGPSLKYLGAAYVDGTFGAWAPIAAEQTAGGYQLAWRFGTGDQYVVWNLDGAGNYLGNATGYVGGADMSLQVLETAFQQDLNGNGHIGPTTTTIENFGATRLDEVGNQFVLRDGEGGGPALKYLGAAFTEGLFGAWNPIGAERTADGYQVAWKFGAADQFVLWNLDSGGNFTGDATGVLSGADLSLQMRETAFQQDLNGNGHIGPTTTTIENFGATRLDEVGNQFFLHDAEGAGPSLKYLGTAFTEGQFVAWEPIAAEQMAGGYLVAWKNGAADEYVVWSTDSGGNYNGNATGYVAGSSLSLQALETTFHQDLNRDGTIYNPLA